MEEETDCCVTDLGSPGVNALAVRWGLSVSWSENCWKLWTQAQGECVSTPHTTKNRFGFKWAREVPESNDLIKGSELWTHSLIQAFLNELDHSIERRLDISNKTSYFGLSLSTVLASLPLSVHPVGFHQFSKVYVGFLLPSGLFNLD